MSGTAGLSSLLWTTYESLHFWAEPEINTKCTEPPAGEVVNGIGFENHWGLMSCGATWPSKNRELPEPEKGTHITKETATFVCSHCKRKRQIHLIRMLKTRQPILPSPDVAVFICIYLFFSESKIFIYHIAYIKGTSFISISLFKQIVIKSDNSWYRNKIFGNGSNILEGP